MDFMVYPKNDKSKYWLFKENDYSRPFTINTDIPFEKIIPTTYLNHQNKILAGQGFTLIQRPTNRTVRFKVFSNGISSPINSQYEKYWYASTYQTDIDCDNRNTRDVIPREYMSGDFNGDGLSDVLALSKEYGRKICYAYPFPPHNCTCQTTNLVTTASEATFVNLDRRKTTGYIRNSGNLSLSLKESDRVYSVDVNGDGKTDILHFSQGRVDAYTLNGSDDIELLWQTSNPYIRNNFPIYIGDYNGDGKTDFITPVANNSKNFVEFMSTGISFLSSTRSFQLEFLPTLWNPGNATLYSRQIVPVDYNGDGKTDLITYNTETKNGSSNGKQTFKVYYNRQNRNGSFSYFFSPSTSITKTGNLIHNPVPVFLTSEQPNYGLEFAAISNGWVHSFKSRADSVKENLLKKVINNGVTESINYGTLDPLDTSNGQIFREHEQSDLSLC